MSEASQTAHPGEGDRLPDFDLPATVAGRVSNASLQGRPAIVFLYPKADTSGCTQEAREFQAELDRLGDAAPVVIGVSRDTPKKLAAFAAKADLRFPLVSDSEGVLVEGLGSWVEKSMYGRTYMGIDRSTFLVDAKGRIARVWRKVKIPGHAAAVVKAAGELAGP
ncbi:peroxiredoxin [Acetobacteraceae bacterium KSS8]|uniref:thioredoxin-dependent peroxiredoxin n=1 Tax=Endosaccharibacter trunci TaxID=2812733 RepID=A0ABT1W242_9PROT|nr:peroxiredoxin [Acetobacteraceae bacterium KSS8]